jgi:hypothetical protein
MALRTLSETDMPLDVPPSSADYPTSPQQLG